MHSGKVAAMPPARNEATLSFCHGSRSVRITTAILVSNCMLAPMYRRRSGARSEPGISKFSDVQKHITVRCFASLGNDDNKNQSSVPRSSSVARPLTIAISCLGQAENSNVRQELGPGGNRCPERRCAAVDGCGLSGGYRFGRAGGACEGR